MKALLVEVKALYRLNKRTAIILLPSGKLELEAGDPASIIMEFDGEDLSVRVLSASDFASFRVIKEINISSQLFIRALEYRNARIAYEREKVEFKDCLLHEIVDPNCDVLAFLDFGHIAL